MTRTNKKEQDQERYLETTRENAHTSGAAQTQKAILAAAGFSPLIVKEAVRQLALALKSDKVRFAVSGGQVIDSISIPDTDSRLKACGLVFSLAGLSKGEESNKIGSVTVQIVNYAAPIKAV